MKTLAQDLRYAFRVLWKSPGFAGAAVLILALGIGANTAIFSVVNAVLLRPLPFEDADRLAKVWHVPPAELFHGMTRFSVSPGNYLDWRRQNGSFETMAAYALTSVNLTGLGAPEAVPATVVTADFFSVMRARPSMGRAFAPGEDDPGKGPVVVLSHAFWKSHLGGAADAVGRKIQLDGAAYTVIGVMPAKFDFPDRTQLWTPLAWSEADRAVRGIHDYLVVGRLKDGVAVAKAQAEMDTISRRLADQFPKDNKGWGAVVVPLREDFVGDVRPALLVLLGAVAFVLLIACANVANLMLARTLARQKEIALRTALGASRGRVLRQLLSESLLLALTGGAAGLLLARAAIDSIVTLLAQRLPRAGEISLDLSVLAFTFAVSVATGVLAGLLPAWRMTKTSVNDALKQGLGRADTDSGGTGTRGLLVTAEVALALVLMVGAGLMVRSLWQLRRVDPGLDPRNVLTMSLAIPQARYAEPSRQNAFYERVLDRTRALPGVEAAGAISTIPMTGRGSTQPVAIEGRPAGDLSEQPEVAVRLITPGALRTLRIAILKGRDLAPSDAEKSAAVVLVSESMAKRFWPDGDALGKRLTLSFFPGVTREVVGIVRDVKLTGLDVVNPVPTLYAPLAQIPMPYMALVVRTVPPPETLTAAVTAAIHEIDPEQPVVDVATMNALVDGSLSPQRFNMLLLAAFALLALLLASAGIYSVLSYGVRRRAREIGIRMALGAQLSDVLRMIVVQGMRPALLGLAIGLAGALALRRVMSNLVFGVTASDPATFAAVAALLAAVALAACAVPAYRATRVEPMEALREG